MSNCWHCNDDTGLLFREINNYYTICGSCSNDSVGWCDGCGDIELIKGYNYIQCGYPNCSKKYCNNSMGGHECDITNDYVAWCISCSAYICMDHRTDISCNDCNPDSVKHCVCLACLDNTTIDEIVKNKCEYNDNGYYEIDISDEIYYVDQYHIYCHSCLDNYNIDITDIVTEVVEPILQEIHNLDNILEFLLINH